MKNNLGFTLIEVLIALTILSIALTAVIVSSSQNIKDTAYLQHKTLGLWVGKQMINEARLNLLKLPPAPDHFDQETVILGKKFFLQGSLIKTPSPYIQEMDVRVFQKKDEEPLVSLKSYWYVQKVV